MCKTILLLCVLFLTAGIASAETLLWSDEFDGTAVDTDVWNFDIGRGTNGWGNSELQYYREENASVSGGNLVIDIKDERFRGANYTSARMRTDGKVQFQYGHVVARINVPDLADGLWPAWWTMGEDFFTAGWPDCGELDIMEMGGEDAIIDGVTNRRVYSAAHWDYMGNYAGYGLSYDASSDLNGSWHVWEMTWTPTMINTYLDGQHIWAFDISPIEEASLHEFHQPHFMIINCAVGGSFTGYVNPPTAPLPANMLVDYIRLYDNGYTTNVTIPDGEPPPPPIEMHVSNIDVVVVPAGGPFYKAEATVTIVDANVAPVSGATVYGTFSGASSDSVSGDTDADGNVTLVSSKVKGGGTWTFCVDNVTKDGYIYDSAANVETCDSGSS